MTGKSENSPWTNITIQNEKLLKAENQIEFHTHFARKFDNVNVGVVKKMSTSRLHAQSSKYH